MYIHYTSKQIINISKPFKLPNGNMVSFGKNITDSKLATYDIYPFTIVEGAVDEVEYSLDNGQVIRTNPIIVPEPIVISEITSRQFRLSLLAAGVDPGLVEQSIIDNVTDPVQQKAALIEWEYANSVQRDNPLVATLGAVMGKSEEELNAIFEYGYQL